VLSLVVLGAFGPSVAQPGPAAKPLVAVTGGSFPRRHEQYVALVQNGSDRALAQLVAAYRRRDLEPTERARIVTLACDGFRAADWMPSFADWRDKDDSEADAWLWYRSLLRDIGASGPARAYAAAQDASRPVVLRAAAVRALAAWADEGLPAFVAMAAKDLGKPPGRDVWAEALAAALASQPGRVGAPEVRGAVLAVLPWLRDAALSPRTRLQVARGLSRLLQTPQVPFEPSYYEAWLDRLARPPRPEDDRYGAPRFFGVEASGDRVVYVIDLSGSMNGGLTPGERKELRELVDARKASASDPIARIPLEAIRTRLDAAVEFTKASIRGLKDTAWFAVIYFSSSFAWADGETELRPATKLNVAAALKSVDRTRMGYGTNLHGGLRRAFETLVPGPGRRTRFEGSTGAPDDLVRAPTTIFVLSDGAPNWDDWAFGGREPPAAPSGPGGDDPPPTAPYEATDSLVDDIARMNLLRDCDVHAIGIGEYDPGLLDRIVHVGHGTVRRIGVALTDDEKADARAKRSHWWRRLIESYKNLGLPVTAEMQKYAAEEAKQEREAAEEAAKNPPPAAHVPTVPAPAGPTTPEDDVRLLEADASSRTRCEAAARLAERGHGTAIPTLARVLSKDSDPDVQRACDAALRRLAGRGFGDGMPDAPEHDRVAVRRNWDWWWGLHHGEVEKAMAARLAAEKSAAGKPASPADTPPGSTGGAPAK